MLRQMTIRHTSPPPSNNQRCNMVTKFVHYKIQKLLTGSKQQTVSYASTFSGLHFDFNNIILQM